MSKTLYGVYGASGCGRGVMPLARHQLAREKADAELVFVDDAGGLKTVNGHRVLTYDQFLDGSFESRYMAVAIADGKTRERLAAKCEGGGVRPWSLRADNIVIMDEVDIGEGALLSPFVTITSNIRIGRFFHANLYAYVEHDCRIGDFVTFAPGVHCNGNVVIGDHAYLGAGCMLRQGKPGTPLRIGKGATVGMGAVVTKNVPDGATVVGNPARPVETD